MPRHQVDSTPRGAPAAIWNGAAEHGYEFAVALGHAELEFARLLDSSEVLVSRAWGAAGNQLGTATINVASPLPYIGAVLDERGY